MADWIMTLPFAIGLLWTIGGREGGRYFRRIGVGLTVGLYCYIYTKEILSFLCIFTFWIATSVGYGKLIEKRNWIVLFIIGLLYGYAAAPVSLITGSSLGLYQGPIAAVVFTSLTYWANTGRFKPHWAMVEGFTGIGATILLPWAIIAYRANAGAL